MVCTNNVSGTFCTYTSGDVAPISIDAISAGLSIVGSLATIIVLAVVYTFVKKKVS